MPDPIFEPLPDRRLYPPEEMLARAQAFHAELRRRRTVRDFSDRPVPRPVIETCLAAAGTAPSGANLQPWHFTVVTQPDVKRQIRLAAEDEERAFYAERASPAWLEALRPLGTDWRKPFLETAPVLIAIFGERWAERADGAKVKNYYVTESVGIATGFLIAALNASGLATLTHTPSPMGFLNELCRRPAAEKPFLLLVVGYPAEDCMVPQWGGIKKPLETIVDWL